MVAQLLPPHQICTPDPPSAVLLFSGLTAAPQCLCDVKGPQLGTAHKMQPQVLNDSFVQIIDKDIKHWGRRYDSCFVQHD